jgi:hypothetical protein
MKEATVDDGWDGQEPGESAVELVHNQPLVGEPGHFMFEGEEGAVGLATFDPEENKYWIVWVQCPTRAEPPATQSYRQQFAASPDIAGAL